MKGRWEGKLIHMRRDGSKVTVAKPLGSSAETLFSRSVDYCGRDQWTPSDFQLRVIREGIAFVPESTEMFKRSTSMPENFLNID